MPGGRLTHQDRGRIATGLADGLTYAEIARSLARPTSTVSREVTRNGGPEGYRADEAQRATEQRAHRRKPTPLPPAPGAADVYGRDPEAVHGFEERFAALLVQTGFPRMMARVLACLYTTDTGGLTAAELVQRLRVSPASISLAIGFLEERELVRRERGSRGRRERYVIDDDVWYRALLASARTNAGLADAARHGAEVLGAVTPAGARLEDMGQFLAHVCHDLVERAEYWRQVFAAHRTADRRPG
ncbi:helix-turn-helix domain-containing protein [Kitasatospora sp. NPDC052896]|uniref:helix-turn-helix domain-containing protein n=1 Tax=Kitasatospora sp. NPDC052896 TaxID=3364061 RepID=UPI0037C6A9AA